MMMMLLIMMLMLRMLRMLVMMIMMHSRRSCDCQYDQHHDSTNALKRPCRCTQGGKVRKGRWCFSFFKMYFRVLSSFGVVRLF